jgi:hypothetical protein
MGEGKVHSKLSWGQLEGKSHLEEPDVDGNIILNLIFKKWDRAMGWIYLPQDRDR